MKKPLVTFVFGCVVGVALTAVAAGNLPQRKIGDALRVSPKLYSVRLENARVRILDYHLAPGQIEQLHKHQAGVAYIISGAKLRAVSATGDASEETLNAGDVHWREKDVTHAVQNVGTTEMRALIVELKEK